MNASRGARSATATATATATAAASAGAAAVLAVCGFEAWRLFHRDHLCWGKGPGWVAPELGAIALGCLGVPAAVLALVVALLRVSGRGAGSRAAGITAWVAVTVTVLCGIGMVLLGTSSYCD